MLMDTAIGDDFRAELISLLREEMLDFFKKELQAAVGEKLSSMTSELQNLNQG